MGFNIKKIAKGLVPKTGNKTIDRFGKKIVQGTAMVYGQKDPYKAPSAGPPGEDPALTALRHKTQDEAYQFRQDMPGLMKEQENILQTDANRAIDSGVKGERTNYNNRGLLYSGMRQGAEGDVKARVAGELARSTADTRKRYEDTARSKENVAAQVGLAGYQEALRMAQDVYNLQSEKNIQNRQQMQQLGQAGGYAAGTYASGGFNRPAQAQQAPQVGSTYARPNDYDYYGRNSGLMEA